MKDEFNFTLLLVVSTEWCGVQIQSMYDLTWIDYFPVVKKKIHIDEFQYRLLRIFLLSAVPSSPMELFF